MKVKELIELLKQCNQEKPIVIFTPDAIPYEVENVIVDKNEEQQLSHINLKEPDNGMI